jgi:hypothetical protein
MDNSLKYVNLAAGSAVPELHREPTRVVVILDSDTDPEWQHQVSQWLISIGCLYMMAWGPGCSSWDDSVDHANLEAFDFGEIPEGTDTTTTWHEHEPLHEVMWFAKNCASHPTVELTRTLLLHIGAQPREGAILSAYDAA